MFPATMAGASFGSEGQTKTPRDLSPRGVDRDFLSAANQSCYRVNPLPCGKVHAFSKPVNRDFTGPGLGYLGASPGLTGIMGGATDRNEQRSRLGLIDLSLLRRLSKAQAGRREGSRCEAERAAAPEAYLPYVEGRRGPLQRSRWALIVVRATESP